jgi:hypothetical protein
MGPLPRHAALRAARADGAVVAETRFSGCIVWCAWPRADVARLLPPALRLDPPRNVARDRHPLVFVFGEHDRSAVRFASLTLPTDVRFHELVIAVPFVCDPREGRRALFLPRVFSGEPVVTWSGNAHYGFAKRMVPMEWLGDTFVVSDEAGNLLVHATTEPAGTWKRAQGSRRAALGAAVTFSRLPVLGHRRDGSLVCSHFYWDFADAWIRPARARISIDAPVTETLTPAVGHGAAARCLAVSGMRWRLSWPEASAR